MLWLYRSFTGYLKECGRRSDGETFYISLAIPNTEIRSIYRQSILTWFGKKMKTTDRSPFVRALEQGDCQTAENFISAQLLDTISYFDYGENYYHGFLAGLLSRAPGYQISSFPFVSKSACKPKNKDLQALLLLDDTALCLIEGSTQSYPCANSHPHPVSLRKTSATSVRLSSEVPGAALMTRVCRCGR